MNENEVLLLGCGPSLELFKWPTGKIPVVCGVNDSWKKSMENGRRLDIHVFGNQAHVEELQFHNPAFIYNFSERGEIPSGRNGRVLHRRAYPKNSNRPGWARWTDDSIGVFPGGSLFVALQVLENLLFREVWIAGLDWSGAHYDDPERWMDTGLPTRQKAEFEVVLEFSVLKIVNLNANSRCRVFPFGEWEIA